MQKITLLFTFLITLALSTVVIVFFDREKTTVSAMPKELYQVYLAGEKIGVIKSKEKLEDYIDKKQNEIKNKYKVDYVYPPKNLNIQKYVSYGEKVLSEEEVYDLIKEKSPFTIKGYVIKIKGEEEKVINVIDKDLFTSAVTKSIQSFVPKDEYQAFKDDKQKEITSTGKIIEDLYISEDITIKQDFISTDEYIFTEGNLLDKYLLFGTVENQQKYIVKDGDTIEQISFNHKLGTEEFLVVNPEFTNSNSLLYPGQEVSVGLISPIFNIVVEEHVVEDQSIKYETETTYDSSLVFGTTKVTQEGVEGVERVILKRQTTNGAITNVQIDRGSSYVLKDPVKKIIVKGTKSPSGGTVVVSSDGVWYWPTNTPYVITSRYGYRWGKFHEALDISGTGYGSPIYAASDGVVARAGYDRTCGNNVVIQHANEYYTLYCHLAKVYVKTGQTVKGGKIIASMGNSGYVVGTTGTHVHFALFIGGMPYSSGSKSANPSLLYR
jgi:murein DD-endopeptidase MepM/ murein hydrolase activator NlpD